MYPNGFNSFLIPWFLKHDFNLFLGGNEICSSIFSNVSRVLPKADSNSKVIWVIAELPGEFRYPTYNVRIIQCCYFRITWRLYLIYMTVLSKLWIYHVHHFQLILCWTCQTILPLFKQIVEWIISSEMNIQEICTYYWRHFN